MKSRGKKGAETSNEEGEQESWKENLHHQENKDGKGFSNTAVGSESGKWKACKRKGEEVKNLNQKKKIK